MQTRIIPMVRMTTTVRTPNTFLAIRITNLRIIDGTTKRSDTTSCVYFVDGNRYAKQNNSKNSGTVTVAKDKKNTDQSNGWQHLPIKSNFG